MKQFVSLRQKKQGRETYPGGCGRFPYWRGALVKRQLNHLYRAVLLGLCLPLAGYLLSFPTWLGLGLSPVCLPRFWPRWILAQRPVGGLIAPIMGWQPLLLVVLSLCSSRAQLLPLCPQRSRENRSPIYSAGQTPTVQRRGPSTSHFTRVVWGVAGPIGPLCCQGTATPIRLAHWMALAESELNCSYQLPCQIFYVHFVKSFSPHPAR